MGEARWIDALRRRSLPTRRMLLKPGDAGQVPVTKIGGAPWWPKSEPRPQCRVNGHLMSFMAQVALADVPRLPSGGELLSFHYCDDCARDGLMSYGWQDRDEENRGGYDLRLFRALPGIELDELGMVTPSSLPPRQVSFSIVDEVPGWEEYGDELRRELPGDYPTYEDDLDEKVYPGLVHVQRSKVGGWPHWVQTPEWPRCDESGQMTFVCQIDWELGRDASWGGGGYAYIFVCPPSCGRRKSELVIQTT